MTDSPNKRAYFLFGNSISDLGQRSFILMKRGIEVYTLISGSWDFCFNSCLFPFIARSLWKDWEKNESLGCRDRIVWQHFWIPAFTPWLKQISCSAVCRMVNALPPIFTLIAGMLFFGEIGTKPHYRTRVWIGGCFTIDIWKNRGAFVGKSCLCLVYRSRDWCYALSVNIQKFPDYNKLCSQYRVCFVYRWDTNGNLSFQYRFYSSHTNRWWCRIQPDVYRYWDYSKLLCRQFYFNQLIKIPSIGGIICYGHLIL